MRRPAGKPAGLFLGKGVEAVLKEMVRAPGIFGQRMQKRLRIVLVAMIGVTMALIILSDQDIPVINEN